VAIVGRAVIVAPDVMAAVIVVRGAMAAAIGADAAAKVVATVVIADLVAKAAETAATVDLGASVKAAETRTARRPSSLRRF
jgi:hypothetical protein